MNYGTVPLAPLLFLDDVIKGSENVGQARIANQKVNILLKQRCLGLNGIKSFFSIIGSKKQKKEIRKQLENDPLMCGKIETKKYKTLFEKNCSLQKFTIKTQLNDESRCS